MDQFGEIWCLLLTDLQNPEGYFARIGVPLLAAVLGALLTVVAGWVFASRSATKQKKEGKIAALNEAQLLASTVCASSISLKRQYLKDLCADYFSDRTRILQEMGVPTVKKKFEFLFDLQMIDPPRTTEKELFDVTNIKLLNSRMSAHAIAASNSVENYRSLLAARNKWIEDFMVSGLSEYEKMIMYFGIKNRNNILDNRYLNLIEGLRNSIDDAIFHSHFLYLLITNELVDDVESYHNKYGKKIVEISFSDYEADQSNLFFPDTRQYESWLKEPNKISHPWYRSRKKRYDMLREFVKIPKI